MTLKYLTREIEYSAQSEKEMAKRYGTSTFLMKIIPIVQTILPSFNPTSLLEEYMGQRGHHPDHIPHVCKGDGIKIVSGVEEKINIVMANLETRLKKIEEVKVPTSHELKDKMEDGYSKHGSRPSSYQMWYIIYKLLNQNLSTESQEDVRVYVAILESFNEWAQLYRNVQGK